MPPRSRLRELGRAALGRVPGPVRSRVLGAVGGRAGLTGAEIGLVSVVVVPEAGDRVEDCLASVRGQTHALLDVVVCPVGSAGADLPDDPRFRAIAPSPTTYDAVRAGVRAAAGRYVVLVRGCDQLLPHAVSALAGSLAAQWLQPRHRRPRAGRRARAVAGARPGRDPRDARLGTARHPAARR